MAVDWVPDERGATMKYLLLVETRGDRGSAVLGELSSDRLGRRSPRHRAGALTADFSQTEMCLVLSAVNGSRFQPPQRSRSAIPAS